MTEHIYQAFPSERVEVARDAIQKLWTRLERAAIRAGQPAPTHPVLVETERRVVGECWSCKARRDGKCVGTVCGRPCTGTIRGREVVDLTLDCGPARLDGWDFIAVVEPLVGGNLIRQVPGADVEDGALNAWRTGDVVCDHCTKRRQRKETFLVRATPEHPRAAATAAELDGTEKTLVVGDVKQVGRQCLADFLGGKSPAEIIARLSLDQIIRDAGGGDEEGGWSRCAGPDGHDPIEFLTWVAAVVRVDGWVSKGQARERVDGPRPTSEIADYLLTPQYSPRDQAKWHAARAKYAPTEDDAAKAAATLEYARALEGTSDYERNLRLVAEQPIAGSKHLGILASALPSYERHLGRQVERARKAASPSQHVGAVGDKVEWLLAVERVHDTETQYGAMHIHTMRDAAGNAVVWRTNARRLEPGEHYRLKGTIKRHDEFRGERQTELTRCKVVGAPTRPANYDTKSVDQAEREASGEAA